MVKSRVDEPKAVLRLDERKTRMFSIPYCSLEVFGLQLVLVVLSCPVLLPSSVASRHLHLSFRFSVCWNSVGTCICLRFSVCWNSVGWKLFTFALKKLNVDLNVGAYCE